MQKGHVVVHLLKGARSVASADWKPPTSGLDPSSAHSFLVSASQAKASLATLRLGTETGDFDACDLDYDATVASLESIVDCKIEMPVGTYGEVSVVPSATYGVLVNDDINGLYSDPDAPSGLSTQPPKAGAALATAKFTDSSPGADVLLKEPFEVPATGSAELYVAVIGLHTLTVNTDENGAVTGTEGAPVAFIVSTSPISKSVFYSSAPSLTDLNISTGFGIIPVELTLIYGKDPSAAFITSPGKFSTTCSPATSSAFDFSAAESATDSKGDKDGGYLGKDPLGNLCWAVPTDPKWSKSLALFRMSEETSPGGSTSLECFLTDSAPKPTSGDTYGAGCPDIPSPTQAATVTLFAD